MELKEFVKNVVTDLNAALTEIKSETGFEYVYGWEHGKNINFDVKVEVLEEMETQWEIWAKIKVFGIWLWAKSWWKSADAINNSHRIQFSLNEFNSDKRITTNRQKAANKDTSKYK